MVAQALKEDLDTNMTAESSITVDIVGTKTKWPCRGHFGSSHPASRVDEVPFGLVRRLL